MPQPRSHEPHSKPSEECRQTDSCSVASRPSKVCLLPPLRRGSVFASRAWQVVAGLYQSLRAFHSTRRSNAAAAKRFLASTTSYCSKARFASYSSCSSLLDSATTIRLRGEDVKPSPKLTGRHSRLAAARSPSDGRDSEIGNKSIFTAIGFV